jgi:hypothetical protein
MDKLVEWSLNKVDNLPPWVSYTVLVLSAAFFLFAAFLFLRKMYHSGNPEPKKTEQPPQPAQPESPDNPEDRELMREKGKLQTDAHALVQDCTATLRKVGKKYGGLKKNKQTATDLYAIQSEAREIRNWAKETPSDACSFTDITDRRAKVEELENNRAFIQGRLEDAMPAKESPELPAADKLRLSNEIENRARDAAEICQKMKEETNSAGRHQYLQEDEEQEALGCIQVKEKTRIDIQNTLKAEGYSQAPTQVLLGLNVKARELLSKCENLRKTLAKQVESKRRELFNGP